MEQPEETWDFTTGTHSDQPDQVLDYSQVEWTATEDELFNTQDVALYNADFPDQRDLSNTAPEPVWDHTNILDPPLSGTRPLGNNPIQLGSSRDDNRLYGNFSDVSWFNFNGYNPHNLSQPLPTIPEEPANLCECAQLKLEIEELREELLKLKGQSVPALAKHLYDISMWLHKITATGRARIVEDEESMEDEIEHVR